MKLKLLFSPWTLALFAALAGLSLALPQGWSELALATDLVGIIIGLARPEPRFLSLFSAETHDNVTPTASVWASRLADLSLAFCVGLMIGFIIAHMLAIQIAQLLSRFPIAAT